MTTFDERERGEEAKFAHDAQLLFKAEARRNKHLAHWAGGYLGLKTPDALAQYVAEVIAADMANPGVDDVVRKIAGDFESGGVTLTEAEIRAKLLEFDALARKQLLEEG